MVKRAATSKRMFVVVTGVSLCDQAVSHLVLSRSLPIPYIHIHDTFTMCPWTGTSLHTCTQACPLARTQTHTHACTYMHVCMHAWCIHAQAHTHTHTHAHKKTHTCTRIHIYVLYIHPSIPIWYTQGGRGGGVKHVSWNFTWQASCSPHKWRKRITATLVIFSAGSCLKAKKAGPCTPETSDGRETMPLLCLHSLSMDSEWLPAFKYVYIFKNKK